MKKSKSIDLTMKTPEVFIPFDPNKIDRSPIMTPEITAAAEESQRKNPEESKNGFNSNREICMSFYEEEEKKPEKLAHKGSSPMLLPTNSEDSPKRSYKKYFSSTSLKYKRQNTKEFQPEHLKADK